MNGKRPDKPVSPRHFKASVKGRVWKKDRKCPST